MDFSKGYTASFYAAIVDPDSWQDIDRVEIISGSVTRTATDLRQNADMTLREYDGQLDRWVRIYMDARQGDETQHIPLFTGLATSPQAEFSDGVETISTKCYSVLKAAADVFLQKGFYISRNTRGTTAIRELLKATPAPVIINGESEALQEEIVAEGNESNLTMTDKILTAIGWEMNIGGDGTIYINAPQQEIAATFSPDNDIVGTSFTRSRDWFSCPNVFRASAEDLTAVARDDDPDSPLSTVSRGREIWAEEDSTTLKDGETIAQYARRRLKELQALTEKAQYTRRFLPQVNIGSVVALNYSQIQGVYKVTNQSISLDASAPTQEDVARTL